MDLALQFPKHDAYQGTGVTWLGDIPTHWKLTKNKYLFTEKKAAVGKQASDYTLLSLTLKGVIARDMDNPQGKFPAEFNTYKIVNTDNLIFCLFDVEETPRTVGLAQQHGMITGAYTVIECQSLASARYLSYYYLSLDFDKKLKPLYTGLRKVIQRDTFMNIKSPLPPRDEQDRITDFLDQKTAEIDEAIAKKQHLIGLLKEQRAILINQIVTKGLHPDVPMRDSGAEWIGGVPEHWGVKKNKYLFSEKKKTVGKNASKYKLLSLTLKGVIARDMDNPQGKFPAEFDTYKIVEPDNMVFCLFDVEETPRTVGRAQQNGMITGAYTVMECNSVVSSRYLTYFYLSLDFDKKLRPLYTGLRNVIQRNTFMSIKSPLPPRDEQDRIADFLDKKTYETEKAISLIEEEIVKIIEFRNILIADAVTGRIKL